MGQFGKYFDFVPGEKSTKFIDVIKKIKPIDIHTFDSTLPESNINTKNKRLKIDLPAKDQRMKNENVMAHASKILAKLSSKSHSTTLSELTVVKPLVPRTRSNLVDVHPMQ